MVTGAGSGIGKATALELVREGSMVALLGRTTAELVAVANEIREIGGDTLILTADISNTEQMMAAYRSIEDEWGRLDILFANAGINGVWSTLEDLEPHEWDQTMNINLRGTFITVKYGLPLMKKRGGSIIINSSELGTRVFSMSGSTAYSCTKAALSAFAKQMAVELAHLRIRVNAVCPGWIKTEIDDNKTVKSPQKLKEWAVHPYGRIPLTGTHPPAAAVVARVVTFLASSDACHVTGTEIFVDGAESLV